MLMNNKQLDRIYFRYTIKYKDGFKAHDISLKEYIRKIKEKQLIGISFAEYEWMNMDNPTIIYKFNGHEKNIC